MTVCWLSAVVLAFSFEPQPALLLQGATAPLPVPGTPPVLSTVPDPPAGVTPEPGQMSGVPLQVGDLPPGIVAVRVIRRNFQDNVSGQVVKLRVGDGLRLLTSVTGSDGRAQFDGLNVGDRIQIRASVGGENLESQQFQVPAQGGVRLVLVAGVGAPTASGADWTEAHDSGASVGPTTRSSPPRSASTPASFGTNVWLAGLIGTVLLFAGVLLRARRRTPDAPATRVEYPRPPAIVAESTPRAVAPVLPDPPDHRATTFERLVRLEKDHEAGVVSDEIHAATRDALIEELAALDARSPR